MAGTKKKSSSKVAKAPSDFKRRKAKVGSKAGKPRNETDTKFKKASLFVAGKTRDVPSAGSILSDKGKSLVDLALQASHPAAQARQSAMKGLLNVLAKFGPHQLRAHLHIFLQVASAGLVDDDADARKVGFTFLEEILIKYDEPTLSPFLSLLVAYSCSGLHSLDRCMRVDGARAASTIFSFFRSSVSTEDSKLMLPPMVGLLADHRGKGLDIVLKALVTILEVASSNFDGKDHPTVGPLHDSAEFVYRKGTMSRNAFTYRRRRPAGGVQVLSALHHALSMSDNAPQSMPMVATVGDHKVLPGVLLGIKKKLCDILVELMEDDAGQQGDKPLKAQTVTTTVQAVYLVTRAYKAEMGTSQMDHDDPIVNILFDLFPLSGRFDDMCSEAEVQENVKCNAFITRSLLLYDVFAESTEQSKIRINKLVSHWLSSLDKAERPSSNVEVIRELLLVFSSNRRKFASVRRRVLNDLCGAYFLVVKREVARSGAGRMAALMLASACVEEVRLEPHERDEKFIADVTASLPVYIQMWSSDFPSDSLTGLDSLYRIVCTNENAMNNSKNSSINAVMCEHISAFFQNDNGKRSTFEALSSQARHHILGILRILEKLNETILKALAVVCSAETPADVLHNGRIFDFVYSLRKSIPMTDYLRFVISSIGVPRFTTSQADILSSDDSFLAHVVYLDCRVSRSAKAAVECGNLKSLKMLEPQLLKWIAPPADRELMSRLFVLRCRVSICFIAANLVELMTVRSSSETDTEVSRSPLLMKCEDACDHVINFLVGSDGIETTLQGRLLAPILAWASIDRSFAVRRAQRLCTEQPRAAEILSKLQNLL